MITVSCQQKIISASSSRTPTTNITMGNPQNPSPTPRFHTANIPVRTNLKNKLLLLRRYILFVFINMHMNGTLVSIRVGGSSRVLLCFIVIIECYCMVTTSLAALDCLCWTGGTLIFYSLERWFCKLIDFQYFSSTKNLFFRYYYALFFIIIKLTTNA